MNKCRITLPKEEDKILRFKNYKHQNPAQYVVYADFECLLEPVEDANNVRYKSEHKPFSVGIYVKCNFDESQSGYSSYRQGLDGDQSPAAWFVEQMVKLAIVLDTTIKDPEEMRLTPAQQRDFLDALTCHICKKIFLPGEMRVKDHCHFTGKFRGAAHQSCNLGMREARTIPIVFHNLSGYDSIYHGDLFSR